MSSDKPIITRAYLANFISAKFGYSVLESASLINGIFDKFSDVLAEGNELKITNFGTFKIRKKRERIGRNPKTKKEAIISARNVISFIQANALKEKLRRSYEEV